MKKWIALTLTFASIAIAHSAQARDVKYMVPIADAMASPAAKDSLDSSIKFYFGPQSYPAGTKVGNTISKTGKKTLSGTDIASCHTSFVDALEQLQWSARRLGANAVVNIVTYFKQGEPVSSATEFECHASSNYTVLQMKADFVTIDEK